nr:MAG TPA: hypothetical protein [Bacteriophage sp.]
MAFSTHSNLFCAGAVSLRNLSISISLDKPIMASLYSLYG